MFPHYLPLKVIYFDLSSFQHNRVTTAICRYYTAMNYMSNTVGSEVHYVLFFSLTLDTVQKSEAINSNSKVDWFWVAL